MAAQRGAGAGGASATVCLAVLGRERPGMVAGITGVLYETECNIRDSLMTLLAGEFVMLLIVELPARMTAAALERSLSDVQRRFALTLLTRELLDDEAQIFSPPPSRVWAVTIYGGDRRGIVHHVASVMARKGVSITHLRTKVLSHLQGAGIVTMRVLAPPELSIEELRRQLDDVAQRFGVEVSIG